MRALKSMIAADDKRGSELERLEDTIAVVTRTGLKVHAAIVGVNYTHCGVYLSGGSAQYRIRRPDVSTKHYWCEKCFRDAAPDYREA